MALVSPEEREAKLDAVMDAFVDWSSCYENGLTIIGVQRAMKEFCGFVMENMDVTMFQDRILQALDRRNDRTGA